MITRNIAEIVSSNFFTSLSILSNPKRKTIIIVCVISFYKTSFFSKGDFVKGNIMIQSAMSKIPREFSVFAFL